MKVCSDIVLGMNLLDPGLHIKEEKDFHTQS